MRQVARKGLITVAAAGGVLAAMSGGSAYADSGAQGASQGSPGVLSGNTVEVPVDVPVNACGNSANVVGALNPAMGNNCAQGGGEEQDEDGGSGERQGGGDAAAQGAAKGSPGVGSGNQVQVPVDVPVNACGNTLTGIGGLNPAMGNGCNAQGDSSGQDSGDKGGSGQDGSTAPDRGGQQGDGMKPEGQREPMNHSDVRGSSSPERQAPSSSDRGHTTQLSAGSEGPQLAETGSGMQMGTVGALGGGLLVGGYVLYRRARVLQR
ncbi:chaplin [Streptomyces sp. HNM0574]|uniref:chaplin n=1 Tax=Streptomyces sp. HNM0574 TaxID=2714954 RepID=UPI00146F3137|nr:chaplin [Streptomyces sp. HNM0574]NLU66192.1 chaplin [Streptomyces sp. HNM0574]